MNLLIAFILLTVITSCNNSRNATKDEICGRYTDKTETDSFIKSYGTTLNCNGTFESGMSENVPGGNARGYASVDRAYFTGTWEVVNEIPEDVKQAVVEFGLKDNDYAIIKYSSSNGIQGYCLYHDINGYFSLSPLYMRQVNRQQYQTEYGSLGIFDGFKETEK